MTYRYAYQGYNEEKMARAVGVSLPISYKQAREICAFVKHRSVNDAKKILNNVLEMKQAVPFKRFNMDVGHKPGNMAAGRYPQIATKEILRLIESVEKNANNKGMNNDLYISHICSHRAAAGPRSGRTDGEAKRAHVEIVIEQKKVEKKLYKSKKK
jgi:large subunit ribosomal protein L22